MDDDGSKNLDKNEFFKALTDYKLVSPRLSAPPFSTTSMLTQVAPSPMMNSLELLEVQ